MLGGAEEGHGHHRVPIADLRERSAYASLVTDLEGFHEGNLEGLGMRVLFKLTTTELKARLELMGERNVPSTKRDPVGRYMAALENAFPGGYVAEQLPPPSPSPDALGSGGRGLARGGRGLETLWTSCVRLPLPHGLGGVRTSWRTFTAPWRVALAPPTVIETPHRPPRMMVTTPLQPLRLSDGGGPTAASPPFCGAA